VIWLGRARIELTECIQKGVNHVLASYTTVLHRLLQISILLISRKSHFSVSSSKFKLKPLYEVGM